MVVKRKLGSAGLQRRVKPRREDDWEMDHEGSQASSSDDEVEEQSAGRSSRKNVEENDYESGSESESGSDQESEVSNIWFLLTPSMLTTIPGRRSRTCPPQSRPHLHLLWRPRKSPSHPPPSQRKSKTSKATDATDISSRKDDPPPRKPTRSKNDPTPKRSSKHAPQEQSSKRPVSRLREIIPDTRRQFRDPRFDPLAGPLDEAKANKAYAFLDEYRDSEMADLRVEIKKAKDPDVKEALKRQLLSMESKKKARVRKEEGDSLLREHRKREKDLVAQGKTPFYLKKSEQKKQVLVDRYASMSKGQVDRAIERKRKKVAGKEKKEMGSLERDRSRR
ncbi:hypothetical protein B0J13DRAFT_264905 [Dactylonectria estremocensis]|uniref:rRNA biogenesis protein RRP36 n=1 Tax=Dactylonectria estremocensis TaxID=1079267 RepID=A0A9P9J616_9HYPO|nr:hypothetical protein B0J13DRAFT_264905 [Dactylonectria estremocensis]